MTCMCVFLFFRLYGAYEVRKLEAELSDLRRVFHCCKSAVVRQSGHHLAPELTPTSAQRFRFSSYCCSHDHYGSEGVISVFFVGLNAAFGAACCGDNCFNVKKL